MILKMSNHHFSNGRRRFSAVSRAGIDWERPDSCMRPVMGLKSKPRVVIAHDLQLHSHKIDHLKQMSNHARVTTTYQHSGTKLKHR